MHAYRTDPRHGWIMGVCAGIARTTAIDVTLIRIAAVLLTLCGLGVPGVAAYAIAAWAGSQAEG